MSMLNIASYPESGVKNKNKSKLAIIIPVYNTEKYIREMINDLLNQSFNDYSIFVINDGSDDSSLEILNRLASSESRIHVISQTNGGPGKARNSGLDYIAQEKLTFDYIWFCDSDDKIEQEALSKVISALDRTKSDFALFSVRRFDKKAIKTYKAHILKEELLNHEDIVNQYFRNGWKWKKEPSSEAFLNNKIFRFDIVKDYRFRVDIFRAEDFDYFFRVLPRLQRAVLVPDAYYLYRLRKSSLTNAYDKTGDLIVCSANYAELRNRTRSEQVSMQHRLIRAYYLDICQSLNNNDLDTYKLLINKYRKLKLCYGFTLADAKIIVLLGPLRPLLFLYNKIRNKIKKNRNRSNFYE